MDKVLEQLKKRLDETPKEILEKECFEINCKIEGVDHNLPNAKKLLKNLVGIEICSTFVSAFGSELTSKNKKRDH